MKSRMYTAKLMFALFAGCFVCQSAFSLDQANLDKFGVGCRKGGHSPTTNSDGSVTCKLKDGGSITCYPNRDQCTYQPPGAILLPPKKALDILRGGRHELTVRSQ